MKTINLFLCLALTYMHVHAQEFTRSLPSFEKITISPKINVVLTKGNKESVRVVYARVDQDKIHASV